jgi:hypothetical protein
MPAKMPQETHLLRVDIDQSLFILKCHEGVSCLGFIRCRDLTMFLARELGEGISLEFGTAAAYEQYRRLCGLAALKHNQTGWRSEAELNPQLKGLEGYRVEVTDKYNETRRFIVGKSTGWMPCHLELENVNSSGGLATYGDPFKSVKAIKKVR